MARFKTLKGAGALFAFTWVLHSADHIRRGTSLTSDGVIWVGTIAAMLAAVALTLVFTDHPSAPFVSASVFGALAVGVAASHYLPSWGYISEPLLFESQTDTWAALAALPEVLAAAWMAWIALASLRANQFQVAT